MVTPDVALPERGSSLRQRYQLFRALPGDESADVFLARDLADDAPVRIRVVRPVVRSAAERLELMGAVGQAIEWRHPQALGIREVGIDGDRLYVVTERPRGASLRERLLGDVEVSHESRLLWAAGIVDAALKVVDAAVVAGVAHPGLTPDNLFVTPYGEVELGDIGLVTLPVTTVLPSAPVPSAVFVRPTEQEPGRSATVAEQLYAASALLLWLVAGRPPFPGESIEQVRRRHQNRRAPSLATFAPEAPADLVAAVARCLRKDPAGRPVTVESLHDPLRAAASGVAFSEPIDGSTEGSGALNDGAESSGGIRGIVQAARGILGRFAFGGEMRSDDGFASEQQAL